MWLWWPLLKLTSWHQIFKWNHCKLYANRVFTNEINGYPIFNRVAATWKERQGTWILTGDTSHCARAPLLALERLLPSRWYSRCPAMSFVWKRLVTWGFWRTVTSRTSGRTGDHNALLIDNPLYETEISETDTFSLTHCPLGNTAVNLNQHFSN